MGVLSDKEVTGVSLDETTLTVGVDKQKQLTATVRPSDATDQGVKWRTDNRSVATVNAGGRVTGVSAGRATITVITNDGGYEAFCEVTVTAEGGGETVSRTNKTTFSGDGIPQDAVGKTYHFFIFPSGTDLEELRYAEPLAEKTGTITGTTLTDDIYSEEPLNGRYLAVFILGPDTNPEHVGYTTMTVTDGKAVFDTSAFEDVTDEYKGGGGDGTAFYNVKAVSAYLADAAGGNSPEDPLAIKAVFDLPAGDGSLFSAIYKSGKYVALDLSQCESDAEFSFWGPRIVSLILPATATSLRRDGVLPSVKTVRGAAVVTIGDRVFYGNAAMTTVDFPKVTSIGVEAFAGCTALTTADFPLVTSIGEGAFAGCTALETLNFPLAVTSIGERAFYGYTALTTANFPKATSIGVYAFGECKALTTANFPQATSIGERAFNGCSALET
ncbi:MAG: leucine-rich repeat protein, partial [Treponema sp.]|nr:leucine-rich repeat protein [Treponema sp.]